jgi:hypothetical protein
LDSKKFFKPHDSNSRIYFSPASIQVPFHFTSLGRSASTGGCRGPIPFLVSNAIPRHSNWVTSSNNTPPHPDYFFVNFAFEMLHLVTQLKRINTNFRELTFGFLGCICC